MHTDIIGANVACLAGSTLEDAIDTIRAMGFATLGLPAFAGESHSLGDIPGFWFDELTDEEQDALKVSVRGFQHLSIHAPFIDTPLFTTNLAIRRQAMAQMREAIEAAWFLGEEIVTIHANRKNLFDLDEYWDEMVGTFQELGDFAEGCGIRLGIETGFPDTVKDYTRLFLEIDHDAVGATVDVGHVVPYIERSVLLSEEGSDRYNEALMAIVRTLGSKIHHLHLHDVRREDWRDHRCVGQGVIDFESLLGFLGEIGYEGLLENELEEEDREGALGRSKAYVEGFLS